MPIEAINFLFPNDIPVQWSLMIVLYPYITGLVAGAFIVSSLYHVFGNKAFKSISRFALLTATAFLFCATLPLLNHLGHPERALNILITPNFSSAMAGFGVIYNVYMVILLLEVWLVFREDIVLMGAHSRGLKRLMYKVLALGVYNISDEARELDKKAIKILAAIGIPGACLLHGYVGFLFGAIKANPMWSTPLMPIMFLFSAVVSGIALLVLLYQIIMKYKGQEIEREVISGLARWLWLMLIITVTIELLEIMTLAYKQADEWEVIGHLLANQLSFSYITLQMVVGALIPFILLMVTVLMDKYLHARVRNTLTFVSAMLLMVQVFAMRWNVVIGGQVFSKSMRGFRDYHPHFFEKEGILPTILILMLPLIILFVLTKILPPFTSLAKRKEEPLLDTSYNGGAN
jgi:Ni/Fe-hydrogenase subunit HybB-like protein